jgi:hypothetical protein
MRHTTTTIAILLLCALPPRAIGQEPATDSPAAALERGHFAEEHERDFEAAAAWYQTALTTARQMDDAARVEEARAALERLKRRQGEVPPEEDEDAVRAEIEERMAAVLDHLEGRVTYFRDNPSTFGAGHFTEVYAAAAGELDIFGQRSADLMAAFFEDRNREVGGNRLTLEKEDAARVLAAMRTAEADAALEHGARSANPLVRREVMRAADPARHRAVLLMGADDAVPGVREAAVASLARDPRPADEELLRAAFEGGIDAAVEGLFRLDPEAVVARALQADAPAELREQVFWLVVREAGGKPSAPKLELVLRRALEAPTEKERELTLEQLYKLVQGRWAPLSDALRARAEAFLLEHLESLPASWGIGALLAVAGPASLEALPKRMIASPAIHAAENGSALQELGKQVAVEEAASVARIANALPRPENLQGSARDRYYGALAGLRRVLHGMPWPEEDPTPVLAAWNALDADLRPHFASVLDDWTRALVERRTESVGGDADLAFRPGSLDERFLPIARVLVDMRDDKAVRRGLFVLRGVGGAEALLAHVGLANLGSPSRTTTKDLARSGAAALVAADPTGARATLVAAIQSGWRLREALPPIDVEALELLPAEQLVAAFRELWPTFEEGDPRRVDLLQLLANSEATDATPLLVEHYGEIPPDHASLREDVLVLVGDQLYEPGLELLDEALRDRSQRVRGKASYAFGAFQAHRTMLDKFETWRRGDAAQRDGVAELRELLASESREVRLGAVQSLGAVRAKEALPQLVRMLEEDDAELRDTVRAAIQRMAD